MDLPTTNEQLLKLIPFGRVPPIPVTDGTIAELERISLNEIFLRCAVDLAEPAVTHTGSQVPSISMRSKCTLEMSTPVLPPPLGDP